MMGGLSITHWVFLLCLLAIIGVPISKILRRAGHSGWWTIAYFIPLLNLVALWVFAFAPWPALPQDAPREPMRL